MKKLRKECEIRDTNKDGFISRADFELVVQRYRDMGYSDKFIEKLSDRNAKFMALLGLKDPDTKLTYEEAITHFLAGSNSIDAMEKSVKDHFGVVDTNEDGLISFDEWVVVYKVAGIDIAHARPSFDAMNISGAGFATKEEFHAYFMEFYTSVEDKLKSSLLLGPLD